MQTRDWSEVIEHLLSGAEETPDRAESARMLRKAASIYEQELRDLDSAFLVLQAAFRKQYADAELVAELERIAEATEEWAQLAEAVAEAARKLEVEAPKAAAALWRRVGRWRRERLANLDDAIGALERVADLEPESREALRALTELYRERGSWHELVDRLRVLAKLEDEPESRLETLLTLADVLETQLGQSSRAIAVYRSVLELDPDCMDALVSLARLYRDVEDWSQLVEVLTLTRELRRRQGETEEVLRLAIEIAETFHQRLGDPAQAIVYFQEALSADPSHVTALVALEELYEETGQAEQYLETLEAELDLIPGDERPLSKYERMASAWEGQFDRPDRAAACLEKVVAVDLGNYDVHQRLVELHRRTEDWPALVEAYRRFINASWDPEVRAKLCREMAGVFEAHLRDPEQAIAAYRELLKSRPRDAPALEALADLYEQRSSFGPAIECLERLADSGESELEPAEIQTRIGRLKKAQGDHRGAEASYLKALDLDDRHAAAMSELAALYSERGSFARAAEMMARAAPHMKTTAEATRLLHQAARIHLDRLDDSARATELFSEVLALDPEHVDAARPLAELYFLAKRWDLLSPVLDMLVTRARQDARFEPGELTTLYYMAARCAEELEELDKASSLYRAAWELDPTHLPTTRSWAELAYRRRDLPTARWLYEQMLSVGRHQLDKAERAWLGCRLGTIHQAMGDLPRALELLEKVLVLDPTHADALARIVEVHETRDDPRAAIATKKKLSAASQGPERARLLDEIGDTFRDELNDPREAIAAYREALEVVPKDHRILQKLLELYSETRQWGQVLGVLDRFVALENDPLRRGFYHRTAGTICRDELRDQEKAIAYYNAALDDYFSSPESVPADKMRRALEPFQKIDELLTARRDWRGQEAAYRTMIERLREGYPQLRAELWHSLGEIYRSRLVDYDKAIQAFEAAQELDPDRAERKPILAELYVVAGPDHADKAIAQHAAILRKEPYRFASYRALRKIYVDTYQYDKAWCVCSALAFLERAEPEELDLYKKFATQGSFVAASQPLSGEHWRKIWHPDADPLVSAIMSLIRPAAASLRAAPHKDFGLKRNERKNLKKDSDLLSRLFVYATDLLGVPPPEIYLQPEEPGEIALANCAHKGELAPAFVIRHELLKKRPKRELLFLISQKLAFLRAEHYLKLALPTATELRTAFLAAVSLVKPNFQPPAEMRDNVSQYLPPMQQRTSPDVRAQLESLIDQLAGKAIEVDLVKWGHAVDATAHRAGFIVCNHLETACRMLALEPALVGAPTAKDKIRELILYAVSEDYFAVRKRLGLSVA